MPRRLHVFSGPTLPAAVVRELMPDAEAHPPVVAGELNRLGAGPGDVVVIVDGAMTAGNAVRHKEILALVDAGVEVWAAGALGALRGAELQGYGVHAYGRVARLFVRGALDGDDEVAVHDGEPPSVALVDVRATVRAACRGGLLDPESATAVVAAAQGLPPARRTWPEIVGHAVDAGLDADMAWRVEEFARDHCVRLTRQDALGCLEMVRRRQALPPRPQRAPRPVLTTFAQAWREEAAGSDMPGGFVADLAVLTLCRLLAVDFPAFQRRVALRTLAAMAAPESRPGEREGQAMLREFAAGNGLDADSLPLWLAERGLRREELLAHLRRENAVAMLLEAYGADLRDERSVESTLAEVVAEQARRRGFVAPGGAPSWERSWLSAAELERLGAEERIARLAARSFHSMPGVDWRQPLLQELKLGGVFRVAREAVVQARSFVAESEWTPAPDDEVIAWFVERWDAQERFDLALLDRGFVGVDAFLPRARPFHAFDRAVTTYRDLRCLGGRATAVS